MKMSYAHIKKAVRRLINKTGFDIKRYRPESGKFGWLKSYEIRTVVDVGANTGQFAREIRQQLPNAQIYSFEPISECFDRLNEAMAEDRNFKAFNTALGENDGEHDINISTYSPSSSLLRMATLHENIFPHTKGSTTRSITIKTLDSFLGRLNCPKDIMVKMDVQGYEDKVILGGRKFLSEAKVALIETSFSHLYEGQPLFGEIHELMKNAGFRYMGNIGQKKNPITGEVLFEDSIFVK